MTTDIRSTTRRAFVATTAATIAGAQWAVSGVRASLGYVISFVFAIAEDTVERPDEYSYERVDFNDGSVLEFADDDPQQTVFEFGDDHPPPPEKIESTPDTISLPMHIDFPSMEQGVAFFLAGVMGLLLAAVVLFRNMAAGVTWSFSFIILILAGLFGFGLQLYWLTVVLTIILVMVGIIVRWGDVQ